MSEMGQWIAQHTALTSIAAAIDSGATGVGATASGNPIDLRPTGRRYQALKMLISYYAKVSTGVTLTIAANLQDRATTSGTGSTWADFGTAPTSHTLANATTTTGVVTYGEFNWNQDLRASRRYLRVQACPSHSSTATGSLVQLWGVATLLDPNRRPASG